MLFSTFSSCGSLVIVELFLVEWLEKFRQRYIQRFSYSLKIFNADVRLAALNPANKSAVKVACQFAEFFLRRNPARFAQFTHALTN